MKKILIILLVIPTLMYGQSSKVKSMLKEISGQYLIDDNGFLTYTKIVDLPGLTKDEIYSRANNFFVYTYNSGEDVIQIEDREKGQIVGKGLFPSVHSSFGIPSMVFNVNHILRIDAKDNKARIMLSMVSYKVETAEATFDWGITDNYPYNRKGNYKNEFGKTFYKMHHLALDFMDQLALKLEEGNVENDNDDW